MAKRNPANRLFAVYYIAGLPAELCGGGREMTAKQVVEFVMEEHEGQKEILARALAAPGVKPGLHFAGRRFVAICTQ